MQITPFGFNSQTGLSNDWSAWNGSGNTPFASLGLGYAGFTQNGGTVAAIPIDATRFLLVSNGYINSDTSAYFPAQVMVGTLTGNQPSYGDPVDLDSDSIDDNASSIFYRGIKISDGKIYLYYSWYTGSQQVAYAKIVNIDIAGNITFGARSANIGPSAPSSSSVPSNLAKNNFGTPIHSYTLSGTGIVYLVSSTINMDDTITINTPFSTGHNTGANAALECLNATTILLINQSTIYSYPLAAGVISASTASATIITTSSNSFTSTMAVLSPTQAAITYDMNDGSFTHVQLAARIVTYNPVGPSLTAGPESIFVSLVPNHLCAALELFNTGNAANQLIATYFTSTQDQYITDAYAICLAPVGNGLFQYTPVQINANLADFFNYSSYPFSQSALMNVNTIVSPYITYDKNGNYGLTVLNRTDFFNPPALLYQLKLPDGITIIPFSVANGNGTIGNTFLTVTGDVTNSFVPGIIFYEGINTARTHVVTSSSFATGITTVNFDTPLFGTLVDIALTFTGITIWSANEFGLYAPFFTNAAMGNKACLGMINDTYTIIAWSTDSSVPLTSEVLEDILGRPTSLLGTNFTVFIVCHVVSGTIFDTATSANLTGTSPGSVSLLINASTATIFPQGSGNVGMDYSGGGPGPSLIVLTITRNNGNSIAYVNTSIYSAATDEVLAMGGSISNILFNNFSGDNPGLGAISEVQFWSGILPDAQLISIQEALITEYGIT